MDPYDQEKPPVFTIADHGTGSRYLIPAKSADESTVWFLLANRETEPLTVYTDGFRAYDPSFQHRRKSLRKPWGKARKQAIRATMRNRQSATQKRRV